MPTQKDIADRLGVSVSLVSRVLSGKARDIGVTEETIRRVEEAVQEQGYVPSAAAQILKGAATRTLGVVVYDFEDPFFAPLIGALQRLAHEAGYSLVLAGFDQRRVVTGDIRPLLKHGLDGLLILGSGDEAGWLAPFIDAGIRMVRIGHGPDTEGVPRVQMDEEDGMLRLLRHLAGLGHRHIGFVGSTTGIHRRRSLLFQSSLQQLDLPFRETWVSLADRPVGEAGEPACLRLMQQWGPKPPRALVASSDIVALGAMVALADAGLRIPDDIAVAGFDNIPAARLLRPALTTMAQPVQALASTAFKTLLQAEGENAFPPPPPMPFELIERASTLRQRAPHP